MVNIKGTSTALEKPYTKITAEPDPAVIRPKRVLKKSLKLIKKKWKSNEANYEYINDQFRSIRADIAVQKIKGKFVVRVFESHARVALESHDSMQFKQCQLQLESHYRTTGKKGHREEFLAYKLLCFVLEDMKLDTIKMIKELNLKDKANPYIKHALKFRIAYDDDNYAKCFKLYKNAPNKGLYLIEIFIEKIRLHAIKAIAKAYGDYVPVRHVSNLLYFRHSDKCREFIRKVGGKMSDDDLLMCRDSIITEKA